MAALDVSLFSVVWVDLDDLDVCEGEHLFGESGVVVLVEDDSNDTCLDDDFGAELAWEGRCVDCSAHGAGSASFDDC